MSVIGITNQSDLSSAVANDADNLRAYRIAIQKELGRQQALRAAYKLVIDEMTTTGSSTPEIWAGMLDEAATSGLREDLKEVRAANEQLARSKDELVEIVMQRLANIQLD